MKKYLLPGAALVGVVLAIAGGAFALGAFDDDDGSGDAVAEDADNGDALGACIAEDDPNYDPERPCNDTVEGGDDSMNMCVEGATDCDDMVDGGDASQSCLVGTVDCNDTPDVGAQDECSAENSVACEANMRDLAFADLEQRVPGVEITIVSMEYTEWPDGSLGNPQPDMAYTQAITPGFKILLAAGGQQYEYHTDLFGQITAVN
jgi:hypothetical protein